MNYTLSAFFFCLILSLTGCQDPHGTEPNLSPEYRHISAKEAMEMMSGEYILLDVRTEEEFKEQRIDGAVLIPDYEIAERAEQELPDKDALILVYCRTGRRSALAAGELVRLGYTNVCDFGGITDWPYDIVRTMENMHT